MSICSFFSTYVILSGPPLMQPPLGNGKSGRIKGVAAHEGELQISDQVLTVLGYMLNASLYNCPLPIHTN